MTLWKTLPQWLRASVSRSSDQNFSERLLDAPRFRAALERERMRADRRQGQFTLVEFAVARTERQLRKQIVSLLEARLRATDEFGETERGIGVLLPETSVEGARQLADQVAASVAAGVVLEWIIRTYPVTDLSTPETQHIQLFPALDVAPVEPATTLFVQRLPVWKRSLDILAASLGLLLLSPVLMAAAAAIKLTSPGPILFRQRRTGLGGKPFTIYKLRTMHVNADSQKDQLRAFSEQDGPAFKMKNDPRITLVGKYLRKTCLDELPQLWNVLCGDMTLVGPRPLPCDESAACQNWERRRLDVTPGLTCIWQVRSGRSRIPFSEWMRMDLRYIRARSIVQDVKLLWKTFLAVVLHRASH